LCDVLEEAASFFVYVARGWGLTVSLIKSKGMGAGIEADTSVLAPGGRDNRLGGRISVFRQHH